MKRVIRILAFVMFWIGAPAIADAVPTAVLDLVQPTVTQTAVAAE